MSPLANENPMRTEAPLPRFTGLWWTRIPSTFSKGFRAFLVSSEEPSLTMMSSLSSGSARTFSTSSATVPASLYTGMTMETFKTHWSYRGSASAVNVRGGLGAMVLALLLAGCVHKLPGGTAGPEADALAHRIEAAVDKAAWD